MVLVLSGDAIRRDMLCREPEPLRLYMLEQCDVPPPRPKTCSVTSSSGCSLVTMRHARNVGDPYAADQ